MLEWGYASWFLPLSSFRHREEAEKMRIDKKLQHSTFLRLRCSTVGNNKLSSPSLSPSGNNNMKYSSDKLRYGASGTVRTRGTHYMLATYGLLAGLMVLMMASPNAHAFMTSPDNSAMNQINSNQWDAGVILQQVQTFASHINLSFGNQSIAVPAQEIVEELKAEFRDAENGIYDRWVNTRDVQNAREFNKIDGHIYIIGKPQQ
jgi:hypothetical protein